MATRKFIDSMNMLSGILKPHSDIIVTLELCIVNARAHKHTHAQLCICDIKKKTHRRSHATHPSNRRYPNELFVIIQK